MYDSGKKKFIYHQTKDSDQAIRHGTGSKTLCFCALHCMNVKTALRILRLLKHVFLYTKSNIIHGSINFNRKTIFPFDPDSSGKKTVRSEPLV